MKIEIYFTDGTNAIAHIPDNDTFENFAKRIFNGKRIQYWGKAAVKTKYIYRIEEIDNAE